MNRIYSFFLYLTGLVAKRFMKYTADKRKIVTHRRSLFLSKGLYKTKNRSSKGPDEHYGLAEPLDDRMSDEEFKVK